MLHLLSNGHHFENLRLYHKPGSIRNQISISDGLIINRVYKLGYDYTVYQKLTKSSTIRLKVSHFREILVLESRFI